MANKNLNNAKEQKNDEFYTQLVDIENELRHYKTHFKGKVVLCNCDDPYESNFFKYFAMNFNVLGLKKLICTCYAESPIIYTQLSLFGDEEEYGRESNGTPYVIQITKVEDYNGDGAVDLQDVEHLLKTKAGKPKKLKGNGDFRTEECIEYLKEADIVVTNPPFSSFRPYIAQLLEYKKSFILMCRMTVLHYKEIFPHIRDDELWTGYGFNLSVVYKTPYTNMEEANRKFVKGKGYDPDDGYVKVPAICWITNLDIQKRHEPIILYKKYTPEEYPHYENFDAIDVGKLSDIPMDYYGMMGVPDTFFDIYNPNEFEIIGIGSGDLAKEIGVGKNYRGRTDVAYIDNEINKCPYSRIIIRRKQNGDQT